MSEIRQVMVAYTYYQNVAGVWLAVTPTSPLPVTMAEVAVDSGVATGGTNTTLQDTTKNWEADMWVGCIVEVDIGGVEYHRTITTNTATVLTFNPLPGATVVAAGHTYQIRRITAPSTPITREIQHNVAGYLAEADIIAAALAPIYDPCSFRVEAAFNAGGILRATITRGGNTQVVNFNGGVALNVNGLYRFDMMVFAGDTINYRYSVNATIMVFRVQEIPSATS